MESIIQKLYLNNKEVVKAIDDERRAKLSEVIDEIVDIVGKEKFEEFEILDNELNELEQERAYKEGFKTGVKAIIEVLG